MKISTRMILVIMLFCLVVPSTVLAQTPPPQIVYLPVVLRGGSTPPANPNRAIIADHTVWDDPIPQQWLVEARKYAIHFAHTSHGSQIIDGMEYWSWKDASLYGFKNTASNSVVNPSGGTSVIRMYDGNNYSGTTYITPEMYWNGTDGVNHTKQVADTKYFRYSMWSWCGQMSDSNNPVTLYVNTLAQLETQYPNMRFIYMTGHTDGGGPSGTLAKNNKTVKDYVIANNKVLFDFADLEFYDPDGNYYPNATGTEGCTWCASYCQAHQAECAEANQQIDSCQHSQDIMCKYKGKAMLWLLARLAGWDGLAQ